MEKEHISGAYGKVFITSDNTVKKCFHENNNISFNYWEISILKLLKNEENIIKIYDVEENVSGFTMEKMEKTMNDLYSTISPLDYTELIPDFLSQMESAIHSLQKYSIVHFDIKPDNILINHINDRYIYKLCDFGLSTILRMSHREYRGLYKYAPPEILSKNIKTREVFAKYDYWSIGIVVLEGLNRGLFTVEDTHIIQYANKDNMRKEYEDEDIQLRKYVLLKIMDNIEDGHLSIKNLIDPLIYNNIDDISTRKIEKLLTISYEDRGFNYLNKKENIIHENYNDYFEGFEDRKFITAYYYFWDFKVDYRSFILSLEIFTRLWKSEKHKNNLDKLTNTIVNFTNIISSYYPYTNITQDNIKDINLLLKDLEYNVINPNVIPVLDRIREKYLRIFSPDRFLRYTIKTNKISSWYKNIYSCRKKRLCEIDSKYKFIARKLNEDENNKRIKYVKSILSWKFNYIGSYFSIINIMDYCMSKNLELKNSDLINIIETSLNNNSLHIKHIDKNIKETIDYHVSPINSFHYLYGGNCDILNDSLYLLLCTLYDSTVCNVTKYKLVKKCKYISKILYDDEDIENINELIKNDGLVSNIISCFINYNEYVPNHIFNEDYVKNRKHIIKSKLTSENIIL